VAGALAAGTAPLRRREGRAGDLLERGVALADRAGLTPTELRTAYGQTDDPARRVPLRALAVLVTATDDTIAVHDADAAWAAARLSRTAAYERREYFELHQRAAYANAEPQAGGAREASILAEHELLSRLLDGARVLRVEAPFPVDPRRVAAAIEAAL